ncbi:hypothetical protein ASG63_12810 [Methylobacterium sp. Leaf94]|uniref:hypothetical protein n=1 Tax=Methylobacterium sp. Leaf94 TaxID=1736250 RepID=UPI0006F9A833|nr:hypothetical protein [Methylobacterium sp. Leaf94]KQU34318.1 hypothetical protein ASG63_12810 [Methylobacterium sp. Leaf94]
METLLILGALGVLLFSGFLVALQLRRGRRPELRMAREEDLVDEADGEDLLIRSLEPLRPSPIDRSATVLDIEPERPLGVSDEDPARKLPSPHRPDPHRERELR